ncbi:MAG: amidohydrolase family protein [Acidimicrobiaceae bacterium]|nr:amidohydrolase family protein [Acidimicrobiaceae bacterium]MYE96723.1 amidohydrolase family protein [Acidimicrobiaceae bacterium]MYI55375.1 amidohydrolase family protein [Acidimicrobiaceae bacterium]
MTEADMGADRRPQAADFVITGTVVTADAERRVYTDGAVAVRDSRIVAVGGRADVEAIYEGGRRLGGPRDLVIPGLIDTHNHMAQALVRSMALEDLPNITRVYIPAEDVLGDDGIRTSARVAMANLLRAGVTTTTDTTCTAEHEEAVGETARETGIRCALAVGQRDRTSRLASNYEQIDGRSEYSDDPAVRDDNIAHLEDFLTRWSARGQGLVRPYIHAASVPSVSDEMFMAARELAERHDTVVMTHINRDREEIELCVSLFGRRPIEHLSHIGALGPRFLAIHAMLTTAREIRLLAEAGAKLTHAPVVCTDIVSAVTDVVGMRAAGVTVGLGCDTVINDILAVMRIAFFMQAQSAGIPMYDPVGFTTEDAFDMATIEGAKALMWDTEIGSLEVGKAADIAVIDGENPRLSPRHNPVGSIVRYAAGTDVRNVLVDGRLVVDDGRVLTLDEGLLLKEADEVAGRVREDLLHRRYWPLNQRYRIIG